MSLVSFSLAFCTTEEEGTAYRSETSLVVPDTDPEDGLG